MNRYHILLFHLLRDDDGGDDVRVRVVHVHRDRRGRDVHDRGHGLHYVHDGVRVHHDGVRRDHHHLLRLSLLLLIRESNLLTCLIFKIKSVSV